MSTTVKPLPTLYSFRRCPYAMRARMALMVAGVHCELREVDLKNKPAELLEISPKGTVPVLQLQDGTVIDESLDIMRWAMMQHDMCEWGNEFDAQIEQQFFKDFVPVVMRYKYPERYADEGVSVDQRRQNAQQALLAFDECLSQSGFVIADHASLSDLAVFPFLRQCRLVDADWFDQLPYPHLHRWLQHFLQADYYDAAMKRVPAWQADQSLVTLP